MRKNCELCGEALGQERSQVKDTVHKGICLTLINYYGYFDGGKIRVKAVALNRMRDIINKFSTQ